MYKIKLKDKCPDPDTLFIFTIFIGAVCCVIAGIYEEWYLRMTGSTFTSPLTTIIEVGLSILMFIAMVMLLIDSIKAIVKLMEGEVPE